METDPSKARPRFVASLLALCALAVASSAFAADAGPERASFQIADGFEVNLFASEDDGVVKPVQCRFDARGRLWVIGSASYPQITPGKRPTTKS
jgi:hypothetical protein